MTKLQELTTIIVNQLSKLYIKTPFRVKQITYQPGVRKGGEGGCCQLKTKKTNEMKLPTCSFSLQGPTGPRLLRTRTRPPSSFVSLSRKEAIILVAQTKRMTTKLRLLSRFNAARYKG